MSTYRERREARAERLEGWADKRESKGNAAIGTARARADLIPFGQPILVGHHSERADRNYRGKINAGFERGFADLAKADAMRSRAANITAQAAHAIYSDDADAIERLTERIDGLEAERARIKAFNVSARKGAPDVSLLDERQRADLASAQRYSPHSCKNGAFPGYALSNLSGNISSQRKRLAALIAAKS
jgi:hypothetical protein